MPASRANVMHNMDVPIKLPRIVSGNHSLRLLLIESVPLRVQEHNYKHIPHTKFLIHMPVKKNQPILVRVFEANQNIFLTWNFFNHLK